MAATPPRRTGEAVPRTAKEIASSSPGWNQPERLNCRMTLSPSIKATALRGAALGRARAGHAAWRPVLQRRLGQRTRQNAVQSSSTARIVRMTPLPAPTTTALMVCCVTGLYGQNEG